MRVMCDMDTDGGEWTVIMRRKRSVFSNVNFIRKWDDYENGFGNLNTEFWLGLRNIHCLTTRDVDLIMEQTALVYRRRGYKYYENIQMKIRPKSCAKDCEKI